MSRSDGTFPRYSKITQTDYDTPPEDYYSSSRRCVQCGTNWPDSALFHISPCCNEATRRGGDSPDFRWDAAITKAKAARFERFYHEWNEGLDDEDLEWADLVTQGGLDEEKVSRYVDDFVDDTTKERAQ